MKKIVLLTIIFVIGISFFAVGSVLAGLVWNPEKSKNQDTSAVDLSDKDTSQPTWSPSFDNATPAGQAPGGPIEN